MGTFFVPSFIPFPFCVCLLNEMYVVAFVGSSFRTSRQCFDLHQALTRRKTEWWETAKKRARESSKKTSSVVFVRIIFCNNNKKVTYALYGVVNIHSIGVEILNTKKETKDSRTFGNRVAKFQNIQFSIIKCET